MEYAESIAFVCVGWNAVVMVIGMDGGAGMSAGAKENMSANLRVKN